MVPLILASSSETRLRMLRAAGLEVSSFPARIDEDQVKRSLGGENATAREMADTLADMKAQKIAQKMPEALILGCDQTIDFNNLIIGKPQNQDIAKAQLMALRGKTHRLFSAAVLYQNNTPQWRHIGEARLTMRVFSEAWLEHYIDRNWSSLRNSAGGYLLEEEGVRLFSAVEGDFFTILGLPLLPLLDYLGSRGFIPT